MSTSNNLYALDTVQDLNKESAAAVQGGALQLYEHANFKGRLELVNGEQPADLTWWNFNDQISSFANYSSNYYELWTDAWYQGDALFLAPGAVMSYVGSRYNDKFSSIKKSEPW